MACKGVKVSKSEYMKIIFKNTHIFPDWLVFCRVSFSFTKEEQMELSLLPKLSCQEHNVGLSQLMVSPSLKILLISVCLLPET